MGASRVNRTAFAILGYLTCWGPMSGYDVKKALEGSASNFWAESYGQIYPILKRLHADGLARPVANAGDGSRGKRVYEVTPAGRKALDAWLGEPTDLGTVRDEFLLKLFFGKRLAPGVLRDRVEDHRRSQHRLLERYETMRRGLESSFPESEDMPYWRMTLRYGERVARAQMDWCNEALGEVGRIESARAVNGKTSMKAGRARRRPGGEKP